MTQSPAKQPVVLVVEELIRMDVAEYLEDMGFVILEAANADQAILMLAERTDIDVVFTDVHMPGSMNGIELSDRIRARWPDTSIIIASGLMRIPQSQLDWNVRFFSKPYDLEAIATTIRAMLNA